MTRSVFADGTPTVLATLARPGHSQGSLRLDLPLVSDFFAKLERRLVAHGLRPRAEFLDQLRKLRSSTARRCVAFASEDGAGERLFILLDVAASLDARKVRLADSTSRATKLQRCAPLPPCARAR